MTHSMHNSRTSSNKELPVRQLLLAILVAAGFASASAHAVEPAMQPQSNEQSENSPRPGPASVTPQAIEQLKSDIIELNAQFKNLEQEYLYPPSVDTALFISTDTGQYFKIKSIEARVDDKPVVGHFYTDKQQSSLAKGGIHRLGEFHLKPGAHQLVVTVIGEDANGQSIKRGLTHDFEKTQQAMGLEVKIMDSTKSFAVDLDVQQWQL